MTLLLFVSLAILLGWLTNDYGIPPQFAQVVGLGIAIIGILVMVRLALYPNQGFWQLSWLGDFLGKLLTNPINVLSSLLWILLAFGYIWWRCLEIGQTPPELPVTRFTLHVGFLGIIVGLILGSLNPVIAPPFGVVILFGMAALLATSLAYTETIARRHGEKAVGRTQMRLFNGLAAIGLVLIAASLIGVIFSFTLLDSVMQVVLTILGYIFGIFSAIFVQIFTWIGPLFDALAAWLQGLALETPPVEMTPQPIATPPPPQEVLPAEPSAWADYLAWGWRIFVILVVLWLFYRLAARLGRRMRRPPVSEGVQTQTSVEAAMPSMGDLLAAGRDKLAEWVDMVRRFGVGQDLRTAVTIRRIYAAMVALVERHDVNRAPSQTPSEFLQQLTTGWPALADPFEIITAAYIQVHYGQLPEDQSVLAQVRQAWDEIYETMSVSVKNE
jgi:hypothetical protein